MYSLWMGLDSVGGTVTRSVWGHMQDSHTKTTSVIWFGSERAQSKHQCPVHLQSSPVTSFNFEAKSQEPHKLWEGVFVNSAVNSPPNTKCTTFSRKLMLGKTLDGEFKLLRIRELDNDDVI